MQGHMYQLWDTLVIHLIDEGKGGSAPFIK
jgi:hypothetical protein